MSTDDAARVDLLQQWPPWTTWTSLAAALAPTVVAIIPGPPVFEGRPLPYALLGIFGLLLLSGPGGRARVAWIYLMFQGAITVLVAATGPIDLFAVLVIVADGLSVVLLLFRRSFEWVGL